MEKIYIYTTGNRNQGWCYDDDDDNNKLGLYQIQTIIIVWTCATDGRTQNTKESIDPGIHWAGKNEVNPDKLG